MKNDFLIAITQVCAERHLPKEVVLEAIEQALVLAYKRNFGSAQNIEVKIDPNTGRAHVYAEKEVVDKVKDQRTQISLSEARQIDAVAKLGGMVKIEMTPKNFGRIAAQTAKQVILQRIREAERETLYADWSDRLGENLLVTVRNIDAAGNVILSLGRAEAIMPRSEQIPTEQYTPNQRLRTYIYEVERTSRGPRIRVSRTHQKLLRRLLEAEVPEIYNGTVEIKGIAREPGSRSKVAVAATQPGVDPVGSCVGMRGVRIQNVVNELNGEKIDVVAWAADEAVFIANALSPAKVEHVWLDRESKTATVVVPDNQLSLAIGKEGQNARLAAKLTGWRIDIKSATEAAGEAERRAAEEAETRAKEAELAAKREAALALLAQAERSLAEEEAATVPAPVTEMETAGALQVEEGAAEVVSPVSELVVSAEATHVAEAAPLPGEASSGEEERHGELELPRAEMVPAAESLPGVLDVPAQTGEPATPPVLEPTTNQVAAPSWEEEEEGEEEEKSRGKAKQKRRPKDLIYDEEAGILIRRTRRKESRRGRDWEDELG